MESRGEGGAASGALTASRTLFDWWERWAASRAATGLMFAWAVAEATVWPVIPDFLLVLLVAANRRRFYVPLGAAIAGSAIGGTATFLFAYWVPEQSLDVLRGLPLVQDADIRDVQATLDEHATIAIFVQPWSGVAYKIWGVVAGVQQLSPWLVIPTFIAARAIRMTVVALAVRLLVGRFRGFVRDFSIPILLLYLLVFFYWWWRTQVAG